MNKNNTVYIAGKVTGLPYDEVYARFRSKQLELEAVGFNVVNPCEITPKDAPWADAMRICISGLMRCDYIYLLPCHIESKGATLEKELAEKVGIKTLNSTEGAKAEETCDCRRLGIPYNYGCPNAFKSHIDFKIICTK